MFSKATIGVTAALALGVAATAPATSAHSKTRVTVRAAPSYLPPPAYGIRLDGRAHSPYPAHDVYVNGKYSGSDPDPFIRGQLANDPPWNRTR
jgi:hypothetical protein